MAEAGQSNAPDTAAAVNVQLSLDRPAAVSTISLDDVSFPTFTSGRSDLDILRHAVEDSLRTIPVPLEPGLNDLVAPRQPQLIEIPICPIKLEAGKNHAFYDGCFLGAGGVAYSFESELELVPPVLPETPRGELGELIIFVNGMCTSPEMAFANMRLLANAANAPVVCLYNATEGKLFDVMQVLRDKLGSGENKAVSNLTDLLVNAMKAEKPRRIAAESHGAVIASLAVAHSIQELKEDPRLSEGQRRDRVSNIWVETLNGACGTFPDGPFYRHHIHTDDVVANKSGLGAYGLSAETNEDLAQPKWVTGAEITVSLLGLNIVTPRYPGEGAEFVRFSEPRSDSYIEVHKMKHCLNDGMLFAPRKVAGAEPGDPAGTSSKSDPHIPEFHSSRSATAGAILRGFSRYFSGRSETESKTAGPRLTVRAK